MRAVLRMIGMAAGVVMVVLGGAVLPASAAVSPAACTNGVEIVSFAFSQASVAPGQTATAGLVIRSCTGQSQQVDLEWYGRFSTGTGTGIPAGCPAIDPIVVPATLPATGDYTTSQSTMVFPSCTATDLATTVTVLSATGTLATATAHVAVTGNAPRCAVAYRTQSEWAGGYVASVTVTNTSAAAVNGWTLAFTFGGDQTVVNAWGGKVTQSGASVTATNLPWNGVIAAGGSVTVGFQGTWHTSDAPPTGYRLNGNACGA
jgi:hypothetical protein